MKPYCVYLTIYRGILLPPFYIGSTSVDKINTGYHGSVSSKMWKEIWESEIKDNPHLFESKIICLYETRQEALDKEYKFHKQLNVVKNPLYINQSLAKKNGFFGMDVSGELHPNFGTKHKLISLSKMSKSHTGKTLSEDHKRKIGLTSGTPHTEESKRKLSISQTGANNSMFGTTLSDNRKLQISIRMTGTNHPGYGKFWMNNGIINKRFSSSDVIPKEWNLGMIERVPKIPQTPKVKIPRIGSHNKGKIWINNGINQMSQLPEDPIPEGWSRGMIKRKGVELPILS